MAAQNLRENGHGSQTWCGFQHRHDLGVKEAGQGIGPPTITRHPLERRRLWVAFQLNRPGIVGGSNS